MVEHVAGRAVDGIYLALKQGLSWSDCVRAAFGLLPANLHSGWFAAPKSVGS